mmetsp:Transcript_23474/g.54762  ORF Transcript_23474/g.54762 Transcript_23474/m.54762 type:complete len:1081 (-) Transcript_23474:50-3292(-)
MLFREHTWGDHREVLGPGHSGLNVACRFETLLPGRSGFDELVVGRPGVWKKRPQVLPSVRQQQETAKPLQTVRAAAPEDVVTKVILRSPGARAVVFAPQGAEDGSARRQRPKYVVPTPPPKPHPERQKGRSRWGSSKVLYTELVQALRGTSQVELQAVISAADHEGATGWPELGLARERLSALASLQVALESCLQSVDIHRVREALADARRLLVTAEAGEPWQICSLAEQRLAQLLSLRSELEEASLSSSMDAIAEALAHAEDLRAEKWSQAEIARARSDCLQRLLEKLRAATAACEEPPLQEAFIEAEAHGVTAAAKAPLGTAVRSVSARLDGFCRAEALRLLVQSSNKEELRSAVMAADSDGQAEGSFIWTAALEEARARLANLASLELLLMAARESGLQSHLRLAVEMAAACTCTTWPLATEVQQLLEAEASPVKEPETHGGHEAADSPNHATAAHAVHLVLVVKTGGHVAAEQEATLSQHLAYGLARSFQVNARPIRTTELPEEHSTCVELGVSADSAEAAVEAVQALRVALRDAHSNPAAALEGPFLHYTKHVVILHDKVLTGDSASLFEQLMHSTDSRPCVDDFQATALVIASSLIEQIRRESSTAESITSEDVAEEAQSLCRHLIGYAYSGLISSSDHSMASVEHLGTSTSSSVACKSMASRQSRDSNASIVDTEKSEGSISPFCNNLMDRLCQASPTLSSPATVQLTGSLADENDDAYSCGSRPPSVLMMMASALGTDGGGTPASAESVGFFSQVSATPSASAVVAQLVDQAREALGRGEALMAVATCLAGEGQQRHGIDVAPGVEEFDAGQQLLAEAERPATDVSAAEGVRDDNGDTFQEDAADEEEPEAEAAVDEAGDDEVCSLRSSLSDVRLPAACPLQQPTDEEDIVDPARATPFSAEVAQVMQQAAASSCPPLGSTSVPLQFGVAASPAWQLESRATPLSQEVAAILRDGPQQRELQSRADHRTESRLTPLSAEVAAILRDGLDAEEPKRGGSSLGTVAARESRSASVRVRSTPSSQARRLEESRATVYSGEGDESALAAALIQASVLASAAAVSSPTPDPPRAPSM